MFLTVQSAATLSLWQDWSAAERTLVAALQQGHLGPANAHDGPRLSDE